MNNWAIKLPSSRTMLLNGAAIIVAGASMAALLRSLVFVPGTPPCSERLVRHAMQMSLERGGRPMEIEDLQGQLGGSDWNLLGNSRVVGLKSGPAKTALEFKTTVQRESGGGDRHGVGFVWRTDGLPREATSVCLTYHVFVPDDFDFGAGGRLPGLLGNRDEASTKGAAFATRVVFDERGKLDVLADVGGKAAVRPIGTGGFTGYLTAGAWTSIEHEIVLNAPGATNGIVRVWANGYLALERTGLSLRNQADEGPSGVLAEVLVRARLRSEAKPAAIWMSPFVIRWAGQR